MIKANTRDKTKLTEGKRKGKLEMKNTTKKKTVIKEKRLKDKVTKKNKKSEREFYIAERSRSRRRVFSDFLKKGILKYKTTYNLLTCKIKLNGKEFLLNSPDVISSRASIPVNEDTERALRKEGIGIKGIETKKIGARTHYTACQFIKI